jgi:uncharacterized surface protein with fasciclin (FAS1) repeats
MKMELRNKFSGILFLVLFLGIIFTACTDITDQDKYQKPEWLAGKVYTQISVMEDLSVFTSLLQNTGYDTILDLTGSYTIFAPTDEAFQRWFIQHPELGGDISNLMKEEQRKMVQYHILQNRWTKEQFQSLDIYGWIDEDDPNNDKPRGYKRQSIYQQANKKYWIKEQGEQDYIVDSTESDRYKSVYSSSRKYLPLFFDEYFSVNNLKGADYEFYYDRSYEHGEIYIANARTLNEEIPAENGFIYKIDQVIKEPLNAEELLSMEHNGKTTTTFLGMMYQLGKFSQNITATFEQPEATSGGSFDTLYNLDYPKLAFNIHEELTGPNTNNPFYTVRYQNGIAAPSDEAFQEFINSFLTANSGYPHWRDFESVPPIVRRVILDAHMSKEPIYSTNIKEGFRNNAGDKVMIDEGSIDLKYYGSNATFMILNKAIIPRALTSVAGPIYLRPGYSTLMYALEYSKTLSALKTKNADYVFFAPSDMTMTTDSSLLLVWDNEEEYRYHFMALDRAADELIRMDRNTLTKRIMNQVGTRRPKGIARKEFIENLAGNFIVIDNEKKTVTGGMDNTYGYLGDSLVFAESFLLEEEIDNGITYQFSNWFTTPATDMYAMLSSYGFFWDLLVKAGLADVVYYKLPFLNDGGYYTVFMPSEEALINSKADTLSIGDLKQFLKYHFVSGERIWTDGSLPSGPYSTLRRDAGSSNLQTRFTTLNIETGYDFINILRDDNSIYCVISEDKEKTNKMTATIIDKKSISPHNFTITGVIHEIDSVLMKEHLRK